jgi:iron complex transport system permease protein
LENKFPDTIRDRQRKRIVWVCLIGLAIFALSLCFGRYPKPFFVNPLVLKDDPLAMEIIKHFRLPRILFAFLLGLVLSASGLVFQMLFRNPLVDSGFLGVSSGAAFGASLAIVILGGSTLSIQILAAFFAVIGLGGSYFLAVRFRTGDWVLRLVLAGIAVSALYTAGTGVLKYLADPLEQLPDITFWLLGGIWAVTWTDVIQILPVVVPSLMIIYAMRWRMNLLAMRDETVFSLSAGAGRERLILLFAAVASTAVMTAKAGQIGWVGLIIPHVARRLVGTDAQRSLPGSMLIGGLFVLICDDGARTVISGEIPLGIITSFIGAALFLGLLMTHRIRVTK